jgi:hypothetical protein
MLRRMESRRQKARRYNPLRRLLKIQRQVPGKHPAPAAEKGGLERDGAKVQERAPVARPERWTCSK